MSKRSADRSTPPADSDGPTKNQSFSDTVKVERIDVLFRQSASAVIITLLATLLLTVVLWPSVNREHLIVWVAMVLVVTSVRGWVFLDYFRAKPQGSVRLAWERIFSISLVASTLVWSLGSTLLVLGGDLQERLLVFVFQLGLAVVAVSVFAAVRYMALTSVVVMLLPMMTVLLFSGQATQIFVAFLALIFVLGLERSTRLMSSNLSDVYRLSQALAEKTENLERAKQQAESATRMRGQFIAAVSHEIRTPMNVLLGNLEVMRRAQSTEKRLRVLKTMEAAGNHLSSLVDNVLDFAKIDENQMVLHPRPTNIHSLAEQLLEVFAKLAENKGLQLHLDVAQLTHGYWLADEQRLRQVLFNLLGNAVKYSERGNVTLRIACLPERAGIEIKVSDQGVGIPADQLEHIFEPYQQSDSRPLDAVSSTGLGLAITRRLVELMRGDIRVDSVLGQGSQFVVNLPLAPAPSGALTDSMESEIEGLGVLQGKRVLLAEDVVFNQELIAELLADTQIVLHCVEDGEQAMARFQAEAFDLLLLDLQMNAKGGLELTREIRDFEAQHQLSRVPIVIQSADNRAASQDQSLAAGADAFLAKPFTRDALLSLMVNLLTRQPKPSAVLQIDPIAEPAFSSLAAGLETLLPRFIRDTEQQLSTLTAKLHAADFAGAESVAHTLKGTFGMFKQPAFMHRMAAIEKACRRENGGDCQQLLEDFLRDFERFVSAQG